MAGYAYPRQSYGSTDLNPQPPPRLMRAYIHLGCVGFKGEMGDPKKTNVVTQNISGEEEDAAAIIADGGSH